MLKLETKKEISRTLVGLSRAPRGYVRHLITIKQQRSEREVNRVTTAMFKEVNCGKLSTTFAGRVRDENERERARESRGKQHFPHYSCNSSKNKSFESTTILFLADERSSLVSRELPDVSSRCFPLIVVI